MKTKNGFFSMSIIYSFFLVFAMLSAVLLSNYAHNRLLIREYNKEIKSSLDDRGNNKLAILKNLIRNGSFENGSGNLANNWTFRYDTRVDYSQKYNGIKSVIFRGNGSTRNNYMSQDLTNISIKAGHKYYVQFRIFTTAGEEVGFNSSEIYLLNKSNNTKISFNNGAIYRLGANPNVNLTPPVSYTCTKYQSCYRSANWEYLVGVINTTNITTTGSNYAFVISQTNTMLADMYIDCLMLIDLTESYGDSNGTIPLKILDQYGNTPWLNSNIDYFEERYVHNKSDII